MSARFFNGLRFFCIERTETSETSQEMEKQFMEKFNALGKYDQLELSLVVDTDGWEAAFKQLGLIE